MLNEPGVFVQTDLIRPRLDLNQRHHEQEQKRITNSTEFKLKNV